MKRWLLGIVALSAFSVAAAAEDAKRLEFAGRAILLAPPEGYCPLDPINPRAAQIVDNTAALQAGRNKLVLTFADCAELQEFRDGKRDGFAHHGIVLVALEDGEVRPAEMPRADFIATVARSVPGVDTGALLAELRGRLAAADGHAVVNELKSLGVLDRDADALYVGLVIAGDARKLAVTAITTLDEIPVSISLYEPFTDTADVTRLLAAQRANTHALVAMNEGLAEQHQTWPGLDRGTALLIAAIGLALGALSALTRRLLRRSPK
ncbi:MAG: hypothetical protein JO010_07135 [Alphaproteobacteria bacterium]|nr:hypothetical protein [Alphaproteobacteria bacterium]